jgi:hypothetical protein
METEEVRRRFWRMFEGAESWTLSVDEWQEILSERAISDLTEAGVLQGVTPAALDGCVLRLSFDQGLSDYEIQVDQAGKTCAVPESGGAPKVMAEPGSLALRITRSGFLSFLASKNGFQPVAAGNQVQGVFPIGKAILGSRQIAWFICFGEQALQDRGAMLYIGERAKADLVVVSMPGSIPRLPQPLATLQRVFVAGLPAPSTSWALDRELFCTPTFFTARDVADQLYRFAGKTLFIDENQQLVFLFGQHINMRGGTRPYNLVLGLTKYASPVGIDHFGRVELGFQAKHGPADHVHDVLKQVRTAIEKSITDKATCAAARALFNSHSDNNLMLPLDSSQILVWKSQQAPDGEVLPETSL